MIKLENASFHYAGEHGTGEGVDDLNLTIENGECVVLCGRSGCGKTTVTRLMNGLAPGFYEGVMEGRVIVDGMCVSEGPLHEVSHLVGSVFQNPKSQFFNVDTTGELAFGCENLGLPQQDIAARLETTAADLKLGALLGRNIFELSGGEKQQIACGSVYATDPPHYVMDEPSSNLDKKAILRLHDALARIKAQGKTIVLSEHRLYYMADLADRFIYMDDGRIVGEYTHDEFLALDDAELDALGLRATSLDGLQPPANKRAGSQMGATATGQAAHVAIEALDLSCNRGDTQILDIEELRIPSGSVVAVIGDNGSGKSTLVETLCGVNSMQGTVAFDGTFLTDKRRAEQSFLVMQDVNRQLFSDSVIEEVTMNTSTTREEAMGVLRSLGLEDTADRHPASLSGGQKQRVAIASALCAGRKVLAYDEPTSGLDRTGMQSFARVLRQAHQHADVSLIVTHDFELVLESCTHVLHIENGRVASLYPLDDQGVERARYYFQSPSTASTSKRRKNIGAIGRILEYAGPYKKYTYAAVVVLILAALAQVVPYALIAGLLQGLVEAKTMAMDAVWWTVAGVAVAGIAYAILYLFGLTLSHKAAYHTLENLRISLQEKLEAQPIGSVRAIGSGAVKKYFSDDIESIELLLAHAIPEGIANISVPAVTLIVLIAIDWRLALFTAISVAFGYFTMKQMYTTGMDRMGSYFAASKRLNNMIIEFVNGMEVVKVFNREGDLGSRYQKTVTSYRDFVLAWYKSTWPWMSLYGSLLANITLYTLPFGMLFVMSGTMSLTKLIIVLCMSFAISPMLVRLMAFGGTLPQVNFKIQALEKAMDRAPLHVGAAPFAGDDHTVRFDSVRFTYGGAQVLRGVSFTAPEGKMTALVGASGSGKSTIARLLVHYYDVVEGAITLGGQDIASMDLATLGNQISYVSQEVFLFNKSILENIRDGKPGASDEEVLAAARAAQCDEFVQKLPRGYETLAGSSGGQLSGGQRQRIALARAILRNAPVVVLDEATAFVDPENEEKINAAVRHMVKGKTVIVIAHRLRTVQNADTILVLDHGVVSAQGTHDQLLQLSPLYHHLWETSESAADWTVSSSSDAAEEEVRAC